MPKGDRTDYTKEFKLSAVLLMKSGAYRPKEIIRILNVNRQTIYRWIHEYNKKGEDAFHTRPLPHKDEVRTLKQEIQNLQMENEQLRKQILEEREMPEDL